MKRVLLLTVCFGMLGCASYLKRKQCEGINWFEHGKAIAMQGKYLNADSMVNECRKVEAEMQETQLDLGFKSGRQTYCSPNHAYSVGKDGDLYPRELCEGPQVNILAAEHKKGINDYCKKTNGYKAGASGKKYGNVCPQEMENAFLGEYRKGRIKYVETMIENNNQDIRNIENNIHSARSELYVSQREVSTLESQKSFLEMQKIHAGTSNPQLSLQYDNQINSLDSNIRSAKYKVSGKENDIRSLETKRNNLLKEISDYRSEIPSLSEKTP